MKYGVPESQWDEMAKHNDCDQVKLWGTTRSRLMQLDKTHAWKKPSQTAVHNDTICLAERKRPNYQGALL